MKYVLLVNKLSGHYIPIVFDEEIVHAWMVPRRYGDGRNFTLASAGFVHFNPVEKRWRVGKERSDSLDVGPSLGDEVILNLFLGQGLSGLDLANMVAYLAMQAAKI